MRKCSVYNFIHVRLVLQCTGASAISLPQERDLQFGISTLHLTMKFFKPSSFYSASFWFAVLVTAYGLCCNADNFGKCGENTNVYVSFNKTSENFRLQTSKDSQTVAHAAFSNCINTTGFAYLTIDTDNEYTYQLNSSVQAYAAGLAEGYVTRELISLHFRNLVDELCQTQSRDCLEMEKFLALNLEWVINNVNDNFDDDYWYQVRLFYEQLRGLEDGYDNTPGPITMQLKSMRGLYLLTIVTEISDIIKAASGGLGPTTDHCSVLIKVLQEQGKVQDVFMAHNTWTSYTSMLRILKRYNFYLHKSPTVSEPALGTRMTFSSYPGTLVSIDDFYIVSSNMVVTETTNPVFTKDLYKKIHYESVLESARVTVANRLAEHGSDWSETFGLHNSGTYNNQWMVVDLKEYDEVHQTVLPGFLTVLEQIPGKIHSDDQTSVLLSTSYWSSYNIPYYKDIYDESGLPDMAQKFGDFYTHDHCPRANIFRRGQSKVTDIDSMTKLMRYNDYKHDPFSRCNCTPPYSASNAIAARFDLNLPNGTYPIPMLGFGLAGATDLKLTTIGKATDTLTFMAISGPTYDPLPMFQWSKAYNGSVTPHFGQPDVFNFGPIWFNGTF